MKGSITNIQRMSIHDGPGIRSTIFMKGCNLSCKWCHNPETFSPLAELEWISNKCINCKKCLDFCENEALSLKAGRIHFDKAKCTACFNCVSHCFPEALKVVGRVISADKLFAEIEQDFPFFKESGGGITISGGEPMLQSDFVLEVLRLFKKANIHTAIETNLTVSWTHYQTILPFVDLVMADIKILEEDIHKEWTGLTNNTILKNIKELDKSGIAYWLRTPIIPNVNNRKEQVEAIVQMAAELKNCKKFEFLPFHPLADSKYKNLGIPHPFSKVKALTNEDLEQFQPILNKYKIA